MRPICDENDDGVFTIALGTKKMKCCVQHKNNMVSQRTSSHSLSPENQMASETQGGMSCRVNRVKKVDTVFLYPITCSIKSTLMELPLSSSGSGGDGATAKRERTVGRSICTAGSKHHGRCSFCCPHCHHHHTGCLFISKFARKSRFIFKSIPLHQRRPNVDSLWQNLCENLLCVVYNIHALF